MKKLYIFGNGFDIAHGLNTDYSSYRDFLSAKYRNTLSDFERIASRYGQYKITELWSNLENSLAFDIEDIFYQTDQNAPVNLMGENEREIGWHDIDVELDLITKFVHDFTGRYFFEWLDGLDMTALVPKFSFAMDSKFITFNYTNTLSIYNLPETAVLYIHGKMNNVVDKTNNSDIRKEIQFGCFENEPEEIEKMLNNEYMGVSGEDEDGNPMPRYEWSFRYESGISNAVKFCAATYKNVNKNYPRINDFLQDESIGEIVVYGSSYGQYDIGYLETINKIYPKAKWTLWGHKECDRKQAAEFMSKSKIDAEIRDSHINVVCL